MQEPSLDDSDQPMWRWSALFVAIHLPLAIAAAAFLQAIGRGRISALVGVITITSAVVTSHRFGRRFGRHFNGRELPRLIMGCWAYLLVFELVTIGSRSATLPSYAGSGWIAVALATAVLDLLLLWVSFAFVARRAFEKR